MVRICCSLTRLAAALLPLYALIPVTANSQTVPGNTSLQKTVGGAVLNMCLAIDGLVNTTNTAITPQLADLHDQCHAIVGAANSPGVSGASAAAAVAAQQVAGNQVSTQGALATRVVGGQFANISGRLNALRLGVSGSIAQGRVAGLDGSAPSDRSALAMGVPQQFYLDRTVLDSSAQADGFAPDIAPPVRAIQRQAALANAGFRMALADGSADAGGSGEVAAAAPPAMASPWGLFVQGSYNSGRHDATVNENPFHFHASSVTAGIDYNFGTAVLGASVGYDDYSASFDTVGVLVSGGSARVEGTSGSLYGAWFGQHWTLSGIATYGKLTTNVTRNVRYTVSYDSTFDTTHRDFSDCVPTPGTNCTVSVNRTLQGDPSGHSYAVGATAGYQYTANSWDIVPSLSASYRHASIGSFVERDTDPTAVDGLPIAYGDQTIESLRSILGVDVSRPFSETFGILTPIVRAEWDHEFKNGVRTVAAHYAYDPTATCGSCLALPSDSPSANYGIVGAGLSVTLSHRIQAFLYDEVLLGFADYHSNSIAVGVRAQL